MQANNEEQEQRQVFIPGYAQPCAMCVYRDFYDITKAAKDQSNLINNLRNQLIAVTQEMEKYKSMVKEPEE